ncbi:MAG TPA: ABC transporter substrate-binding protein [Hyphomicrobiaceae bacterium]|jgi:phospholipid transport system substrate-binding protein
MLSRRRVTIGLAGFAALLARGSSRAEQADLDPKRFIEQLGMEAVEALTGPELSESERERRFRGMLDRSFDLPVIGRFVLGRYWRTASEAEREEFLRLFEAFLVKSYAARFADYAGEQLQVQGVRQEQGYAIVRSTVIRPGAENVQVDWRLRGRDGAFKVVDIVVEGISMAVTQRADFGSVIQSSGGEFSGLIELLRRKTG